jgi:hypothetical protein
LGWWQRAAGRETDGARPQRQPPMVPAEGTPINPQIAGSGASGKGVSRPGRVPVLQPAREDLANCRRYTRPRIAQGSVRRAQLRARWGGLRATGQREGKWYRQKGAPGFWAPRRRRSAVVLTPAGQAPAQVLWQAGTRVPEVGKAWSLRADTVRKAIRAGPRRPLGKKRLGAQHSGPQQKRADATRQRSGDGPCFPPADRLRTSRTHHPFLKRVPRSARCSDTVSFPTNSTQRSVVARRQSRSRAT